MLLQSDPRSTKKQAAPEEKIMNAISSFALRTTWDFLLESGTARSGRP